MPSRPGARAAEPIDYGTLAELRYQIRRFLRARELSARAAGVEPQHYLLLLQIRGLQGVVPATVKELAERLQLRHHTVVGLLDRLARKDMVARRRGGPDRRQVVVAIRPAGQAVLGRLARHSIDELRREGPALVAALARLIARGRPRGAVSARAPRVPRKPATAAGGSRRTGPRRRPGRS